MRNCRNISAIVMLHWYCKRPHCPHLAYESARDLAGFTLLDGRAAGGCAAGCTAHYCQLQQGRQQKVLSESVATTVRDLISPAAAVTCGRRAVAPRSPRDHHGARAAAYHHEQVPRPSTEFAITVPRSCNARDVHLLRTLPRRVVGEAARKHDQSIKVAVAIMQGKYQMPSRTCEETGVYSREHDVELR